MENQEENGSTRLGVSDSQPGNLITGDAIYLDYNNIIGLYEEQVLKSPAALALIHGEKTITYSRLNERVNQFAHFLRNRGLKEEILVPICMERSIDMIIAILAVLKAGAAYVPVDPNYPGERINFILEDTGASLVVSSKLSSNKIKTSANLEVIEIDTDWSKICEQPVSNPAIEILPAHLAYVIYTSGSTGTPKGVMIEHQNVSSFIWWCQQEFSSSHFDIVYASTSICFDLSVYEIFFPLSVGKPIRILENGLQIPEFLGKDKFVLLNSVPTVIDYLLKQGTNLTNVSVINMAGEAVPLYTHRNLDTSRIAVRNLYGPTEDTTYSTVFRLEKDGPILIGKPIANTKIYLINEEGELVLKGSTGEICISGAGLARGYLNRPELTAEKFVTDPFGKNGSRLYKTGDLGRWSPDGNIEYLGRIDNQVKIRGFRVELGEIENVMQQSEMVQNAVVLLKDDGIGNKRLLSYFIPDWAIIKAKERQLYLARVNSWKEIYEIEYIKTEEEKVDDEFNLVGWNDSFTGMPIAAADMRQWLSDIVEIILAEKPENVLEIGCGTGLIYYQLAGKVKKYIGTDFSRSSIDQIQNRISKGHRNYGATELQVGAAHEILLKEDQPVDTVILNSIVQYFPGEEYMNNVIDKSIAILKGKGRIIIGDVRDKRLLKLFSSRLQLQTDSKTQSKKEFEWRVDYEVLKENELCFSPEYFFALPSLYPQITHVEIRWKNDPSINEMTLYRYTVILYIGIIKDVIEPKWQSWEEISAFNEMFEQIQPGKDIAIKDMPNPRLHKESLINQALYENSISTVGDILNSLEKDAQDNIEAALVIEAAKAKGYQCKLFVNEDPLLVNLLLQQTPSTGFVNQVYNAKPSNTIHSSFVNVPLFTEIVSLLQKDIRSYLQVHLPEYMIPSEYIPLDHLPLTTNGKIDRSFLAELDIDGLTNRSAYVAPANNIERTLVQIWQDLLGIDHIGINDDFFYLGGHSLLAIRLIAAVRSQMTEVISLKDLVIHPTIATLANHIKALQTGHHDGRVNSKLLVPLKTNGSKVPLYIISGGGGTVFAFKKFVDLLDDDQPVYGLQQPTDLNDIKEFPTTIEGVASKYIDEILLQNQSGPYALSGHCVGGIIAFEMAKQLEAMGKKVKLLAMFDTILPKVENPEPATFKNLFRLPVMAKRLMNKIYLKIDFELYLLLKHTKHAIQYKINTLKSLINKVYPYKDKDLEIEVYKTLERSFEKAEAAYKLMPSNRHLLIFYAKDHYYFLDKDKAIDYKRMHMDEETKDRWKAFAGSVTIYEVDGEHSTVFDPIHGKNFAQLLQQHLNSCNTILD